MGEQARTAVRNRAQTVFLVGGSGTAGGVEVFNSRLAALLGRSGVDVRSLPLRSYLRRGRPAMLIWPWLWASLVALVRIGVQRPDHVIVSCANFLDIVFARILCATTRSDIAVIAHFNASWSFWRSDRYVRLFQATSRRTRLFAIAESQRCHFIECGLQVEEILFPNFFGYSVPARPNTTERPAGPEVRALYVGRIVPEKKVDQVAHFLRRLSTPSQPIAFRLVGRGSQDFEASLRALSNDTFRVESAGFKDDAGVSREMHDADFLISFSGSDTLPLTYLEAAAHGLPVLTHDNSITRDVQAMTGNIVFVDPAAPTEAGRNVLQSLVAAPRGPGLDSLLAQNEALVLDLVCERGAAPTRS